VVRGVRRAVLDAAVVDGVHEGQDGRGGACWVEGRILETQVLVESSAKREPQSVTQVLEAGMR
jgi:hypothetical protein